MQTVEVNAEYIKHIVGVMKERSTRDTIIFFHVNDNYECFLSDSIVVSDCLGIESEPYYEESVKSDAKEIYVTRICANMLKHYRKKLIDSGYSTMTNEMRDSEGNHILKIYEQE